MVSGYHSEVHIGLVCILMNLVLRVKEVILRVARNCYVHVVYRKHILQRVVSIFEIVFLNNMVLHTYSLVSARFFRTVYRLVSDLLGLIEEAILIDAIVTKVVIYSGLFIVILQRGPITHVVLDRILSLR